MVAAKLVRLIGIVATAVLVGCGGEDVDRAAPGRPPDGVASCSDGPSDVAFFHPLGPAEGLLPAPVEASPDLLGAELQIYDDTLYARWVSRQHVYVDGETGPLVSYISGPFVARLNNAYVLWAYPPGGEDAVVVDAVDPLRDVETRAHAAREAGVVEFSVPLDDLPALGPSLEWSSSAIATPAGAMQGTTVDHCGAPFDPDATEGPTVGYPGERLDSMGIGEATTPEVSEPTTDSLPSERPTPEETLKGFLTRWTQGDLDVGGAAPEVIEALEAFSSDPVLPEQCGGAIDRCDVVVSCSAASDSVPCDIAVGPLQGAATLTRDPVGELQGGQYWVVVDLYFAGE